EGARRRAGAGVRVGQRRQDSVHRGRGRHRQRHDQPGRGREPLRRPGQGVRRRVVRAGGRPRARGDRHLRLRRPAGGGQEEVPPVQPGAQGRPGDQAAAVRGAAAVGHGARRPGAGRGRVAGRAAPPGPLLVTALAAAVPRLPYALVLTLLAALVLAAATAGIAAGSVPLAAGEVWGILVHRAVPALVDPTWPPVRETIVLDVRAPRVLLCGVAGAALSVCGMALQALVRNPLADPMLLGVSSGASVGAVLVLVLNLTVFGAFSLPLAAFIGALGALTLVYVLARSGGRMTTVRLILAGVATAEVLSAIAGYLSVTSGDPRKTESAMRWMLGGFGGTSWDLVPIPAAAVLLGTVALLGVSRPLDLLLAGEEAAASLGL